MTGDERRDFREFVEHIIEDGSWQWDDTGENMTADAAAFLAAIDARDEQIKALWEAGKTALAYLEGCDGLAVAVPIGMLRAALAATAQPEPTLEEMLDSGLVDAGLVAAWEASEYTDYGDEGELPGLIREGYRKATAQPEQDGGWLPMEDAPRDGTPIRLRDRVGNVQKCWFHLAAWFDGCYCTSDANWTGWKPAPPTRTEAEGD